MILILHKEMLGKERKKYPSGSLNILARLGQGSTLDNDFSTECVSPLNIKQA